jgi:phospholipase/lecithinase/hemolysin
MQKRLGTMLAILIFMSLQQARADFVCTFDKIYVFGDSLSDTGNLSSLTSFLGTPKFLIPPKWTTARFTDGADTMPAAQDPRYVKNGNYNVIWHEQLAKIDGIAAAGASLEIGNKQNYAYGGATSGMGTTLVAKATQLGDINVDNVGKQVGTFIGKGMIPATGLYVLWGGGNDLRNYFFQSYSDNLNDPSLATYSKAGIIAAASTAAKNIGDRIADLINAKLVNGATQFLWPDLPPIDMTPRFQPIDGKKVGDGTLIGDDLAAAVKQFKADEEARITALQTQFAAQKVKIVEMDVYTAFNNILANPAKYNYTNVKDEAQMLAANANPDPYLFWDGFHPTSHGHYDIAQIAHQALVDAGLCVPTPEPSSLVLAMTGVVALVLRRKVRGHGRSVFP